MDNRFILVLINGKAGTGKDTFVKHCMEYANKEANNCNVYNIHRSDIPKFYLQGIGWDGKKDEESRSLLKHTVDFMENKGLLERRIKNVITFVTTTTINKSVVIFYHVRDPIVIDKLMDEYIGSEILPISLLLTRKTNDTTEPEDWWRLENYSYTMTIQLENTIESSKHAADSFMDFILNKTYTEVKNIQIANESNNHVEVEIE